MRHVRLPEWALTGVHPDYPPERFITAYGMARSRSEAVALAQSKLETEITAWPLKEYADLLRGTQLMQIVRAPAAWIRLEELGDSVRREYATTGFDNVALCAIRRDDLRLWATGLLPQARRELNETPSPPSAGTLQSRIELTGAFFLKAARVVALQLIVDGSIDRIAFGAAEDTAQRLWELPNLMRVSQSGSGSRALIRGGVHEELGLFARYRGESPRGVPVAWQLAPNLRGALRGDEVFSVEGNAACRVLQVAPNGENSGQVFAMLDIDTALGRRTGILMPMWHWTIMLPSRDQGEVILDVTETGTGAAAESPTHFIKELTSWAALRGLKVTRGAPSGAQPYVLKLTGTLVLNVSKSGDVPIAHTSGRIDLVDMDSGNVLYTYSPGLHKVGGAETSEISLALTAQREATADALIEFAGRLAAVLPAPEDTQPRDN